MQNNNTHIMSRRDHGVAHNRCKTQQCRCATHRNLMLAPDTILRPSASAPTMACMRPPTPSSWGDSRWRQAVAFGWANTVPAHREARGGNDSAVKRGTTMCCGPPRKTTQTVAAERERGSMNGRAAVLVSCSSGRKTQRLKSFPRLVVSQRGLISIEATTDTATWDVSLVRAAAEEDELLSCSDRAQRGM